ncbi:fluoride efflux transporter FluC [Actinoplanes sp. NPDC049265]|uniref:fluoride efflux transporter FluC n=1 Tax=Actinoplanes sp. NPDC049265 TaxID=3363902 RepID=UPI003711BFC5
MDLDFRVLGAVSAGGVIGALARFLLQSAWPHHTGDFPWATWAINVTGCFLIGMLMALIARRWPAQRYLRPFFGSGVLGGYTTFSAWAVETLQSRPGVAVLYAGGTLAGALVAAWAGGALVALGRTR